jgi:hypothetical protein
MTGRQPGSYSKTNQDACLYPYGGFAYLNLVDNNPCELVRLDPQQSAIVIDLTNYEPLYAVRETARKRHASSRAPTFCISPRSR